jgi:hypothetical protein
VEGEGVFDGLKGYEGNKTFKQAICSKKICNSI